MDRFIIIPIFAMLSYCFLMLTFLAAKKNKMIRAFLLVLVALFIWTGGAFLMRINMVPSYHTWYHVSIFGMMLGIYAMYNFVYEFSTEKNSFFKKFWMAILTVLFLINWKTGVLLRCPEMVNENGVLSFVYHPTAAVIILFIVFAAIIFQLFYLLFKHTGNNDITINQLMPVFIGIAIIFLGNVLIMIPIFKGIPLDILSACFNVIFLVYALYKKHLFRLTLLISRGNCYFVAMSIAFIPILYTGEQINQFLVQYLKATENLSFAILAAFYTGLTFFLYKVMKHFINSMFVRDEKRQADYLKNFSMNALKTLKVKEILEDMVEVIQKTIGARRVYVCMEDEGNACYKVEQCTNPLYENSFELSYDNPIVNWLKDNDECILMKDFKRTTDYRSMWEKEKKQFKDLEIECLAPLKDGDDLVGILLLSGKENRKEFHFDDMNLLVSIESVGSIALKNSKMYEKACLEARIDDLTGLYNRKYFHELLNREYEKNKDQSLALLLLSLDDFKLYNQLYGNREGDIALQGISKIIKASVGCNGHVARYNGKEFMVILPGYDILSAKNLGESIRRQIINRNNPETTYSLKALTVSGGVCAIPYGATTLKQLLDNVDMALFQVKRRGKNAICAYCEGTPLEVNSPTVKEHKADIYLEYAPSINALTAAIDMKDHYTYNHSKNVAFYATELAYAYGLSEESVEIIREAGLLHDIGKIGIAEQILNKPDNLTSEEYDTIKGHVESSVSIIRHLPSLDYVIPAVIGHHERYNGTGYPRGLAGEDIPLFARILCVADSFDAMITQRVYKNRYPVEWALNNIIEEAGRQFDPILAELFVRLVRECSIKLQNEE